MYFIIKRIADNDTAEFVWANLLETLYIMFYVSWGSDGM